MHHIPKDEMMAIAYQRGLESLTPAERDPQHAWNSCERLSKLGHNWKGCTQLILDDVENGSDVDRGTDAEGGTQGALRRQGHTNHSLCQCPKEEVTTNVARSWCDQQKGTFEAARPN
jgi:hypothetical protein